MPDEKESSSIPENIPFGPRPHESFRKTREQEAENIRQEYLKSTGRLPLPRSSKSSEEGGLNNLEK